MIKFRAAGKDGRELLGIGLSQNNLDKLKEGRPIVFPGEQIGESSKDFFIFYGETEQQMEQLLRDHFKVRSEQN